jgi:hypothetical protein
MELFNLGIAMEWPSTGTPEALTKEKTIEYVKTSNGFAIERFKTKYMDQICYFSVSTSFSCIFP